MKSICRRFSFTWKLLFARNMSGHTKIDLQIDNIRHLFPKLTNEMHKGECGRIGIIGGSREYTGAPYFAAMTALRLGADLAHIFCTQTAGTAIKCYSPDLIVHPILDDEDALEQIKSWLPRLHAVVIGPGLGRDEKIVALSEKILEVLKSTNKVTVIDADGLFVVTQNLKLLQNFPNAVITPNKVEFDRLCKVAMHGNIQPADDDAFELSKFFNGLTIVRKGDRDLIVSAKHFCHVAGGGSACRCGGQGDVLSGAVALFSYWAEMNKHQEDKCLVGAFAGCSLTRALNKEVFMEMGRSMITGDFIPKIPKVLKTHFLQEID